MNTVEAARASLVLIEGNLRAEHDPSGDTLTHAKWMLHGIFSGYIQHEKAHRWLGYAQALMVVNDVVTLDKLKEINHAAV